MQKKKSRRRRREKEKETKEEEGRELDGLNCCCSVQPLCHCAHTQVKLQWPSPLSFDSIEVQIRLALLLLFSNIFIYLLNFQTYYLFLVFNGLFKPNNQVLSTNPNLTCVKKIIIIKITSKWKVFIHTLDIWFFIQGFCPLIFLLFLFFNPKLDVRLSCIHDFSCALSFTYELASFWQFLCHWIILASSTQQRAYNHFRRLWFWEFRG